MIILFLCFFPMLLHGQVQSTLAPVSLNTYHFQTRIYTVDDGLPTNRTKDVLTDARGFVWIASDEGLVRFDGYRFVNITENLPSRFVKKLLLTRRGRLLAATDGGIVEVETRAGNEIPHIRLILPAAPQQSDSTIVFPKTLFEDASETLWIAEPNAIVRVLTPLSADAPKSRTLPRFRRYTFPAEYASNSVVRSFMFAQDAAGTMLTSGYSGYCFWYNPALDTFALLPFQQSPKQAVGLIHDICTIRSKPGEFLAATQHGLLHLHFKAQQSSVSPSLEARLYATVSEASTVLQSRRNGMVYCGAWYSGIHVVEPIFFKETREISPLQRTNTLWEAPNGTLWASSDQGLCVIAPSPIDRVANALGTTPFLSYAVADAKGNIFAINGESLFRIDHERRHCTVLATKPPSSSELFTAACDSAGGVWVSSLSGWLVRWHNGTTTVISQANTVVGGSAAQGVPNTAPLLRQAVRAIACDASGTLWCALGNVTQEQAAQGSPTLFSLRYDANRQRFVQRLYGKSDGAGIPAGSLCVLPDGSVFAGLWQYTTPVREIAIQNTAKAAGEPIPQFSPYLLRYDKHNDTFHDGGKPLPQAALERIRGDGGMMTVYDMAVGNNRLWVATSFGVLRYPITAEQPKNRTNATHSPEHSAEDLAEYFSLHDVLPTYSAKSLAIAPSGTVWIGTDVGAIKVWNGVMTAVHQASGLVSRTISRNGILIDKHLGIWFSTSSGLYTSSDTAFVSAEPPATPTPRLIAARLIAQSTSQNIFTKCLEEVRSTAASASSSARTITVSRSFPAFSVLEFDISALSFPSELVRFKTCVIAGENDTLPGYPNISPTPTMILTNIATGEYRLLVQAGKEGSGEVWSAPLVLHFRIEPPFYLSTTAFAVYAALLLVLGGLSLTAVRSVRQKRALAESRRNAERLEWLVAESAKREQERKRLSADLHDEIGSGITQIFMLSEVMKGQVSDNNENAPLKRHIETIAETAQDVVRSVGNIIWALNPENDTLGDFLAYVREYAGNCFAGTGITLRNRFPNFLTEDIAAYRVTATFRRNMFLVVKEALVNIAERRTESRVAEPRVTERVVEFEVEFEATSRRLCLRIAYGGGGETQAVHGRHFGNSVQTMRRRTEEIGGTFTIESEQGKGTVITIMVVPEGA